MQAISMLNPNTAVSTKSSWLASNQPLAWIGLPIFVFLSVIVGINLYEATEERRFQARVEHLRSEGKPVDYKSLVAWERARTRSEGIVAWSEIGAMERMFSRDRLKPISKNGTPANPENALYQAIFLGKGFSDDERISKYLDKLRPLFRAAEHAVELSKPAMILNRLGMAMSQGFEGVQSELRLELMYALQHRDVERATNAMDLMLRLSEAHMADKDSQESVGVESYWEQRNQYVAITRSLCAELWDEAYIRQLMERLEADKSLQARCRAVVIRDRALGLDEIPRFVKDFEAQVLRSDGALAGFRFFPVPRNFMTGSAKNWLLDGCDAFEQLTSLGYSQLGPSSEELDKKYYETDRKSFLFQVPYPFRGISSGFSRFIDSECHRRMARTALAVKLFKLKKGEWPKSLAELSQVDFSAGESTTVQGERFGYEVEGDSAFVWRFQVLKPDTLFAETRGYLIVPNLQSFRTSLEEINSAELVRIR